ncbi:sensor histidine kinase [Blautia wexlerae]|uniref:sensor histidine kinase n=1 Tax=Blautia wexlerae TaxID=418240 RepID=UPI0022E5FFE0|nr:sensor histidine kinase [Blautia wexlerae]
MALLFFIISMILLVLYFKEHNKNKKIESDYKYINARLLDIINNSENNYILIPSDIKVVKETAKGINNLLEKFNDRQIDYNRNQKVILQIFTNISHDLRTPITVLKGYIEMLYLQSQKEDLPPAIHATIEKMQRNSQELVHSVNNLFNLAKIQSGDMVFHIQKVNLTQVCHEIILEFYTILEEEKFHVEVNIEDKPLYANVDIEAVGRILKNLIDNAIKYGNAGKFLGISLYKKDNHIYIEVEDHGAGISEKDKIHIFTRAYTADRKKGNGLGLAISQELANSMGGSISVVSIPQEKTVFTIRL